MRGDELGEDRPQERGAITVELLFLTVLFTLPVALTFGWLGMPLLRLFRYAQLALVGPFP
jgi:hypothetical protein